MISLCIFFLQKKISDEFVSEISMLSQKENSYDSATFNISISSSLSNELSSMDPKTKETDFCLKPIKTKQLRKISSLSNLTSNTNLNSSETDLRKKKLKRKSKYLKKEFRAARSLFIVLFAFAVCWLPLHIHNAMHYFNPEVQQPPWLADFAIILSHANSFVNPVIYAFRLREMRSAFRKIFLQLWHHLKVLYCCFASYNANIFSWN